MASRVIIDFRGPQPGAGLATLQISTGDKTLQLTTNTQSQSDLVVTSDAPFVGPPESPAGKAMSKAVPIAARIGAMYMDSKNPLYGNRPLIEIIPLNSTNSTGGQVIKSFDQMFLAHVQEQDSEKTDVHETFGAPYFFASGRFVRRFAFSGVVRAAPVNAQSNEDQYKVTQFVLMRLFYENYMRMSQQALKGWFTRITVNKEIYEGFVSTMNFDTDANNEHVVPFVFSMFGTKRYNDLLDPSGTKLLGINGASVVSPQAQARASAEVIDAIGKTSLKALPAATDIGILNFNNPVPTGVTQQIISLTFEPRPEMLSVLSDTPGIQPVYGAAAYGGRKSNVPVDGTIPPSAGPLPIDFVVTDYWLLYNTIQSRLNSAKLLTSVGAVQPLPPGQTALLPGQANFSIITASKQAIMVAARFHLTPPANVVVQSVRAFEGSSQIGQGSVIPPNSDNTDILVGEIQAAQSYDGSNALALQYRFFLGTPDGSPVPPDALNGATVVYDIQKVYPALGAGLLQVDSAIDLAICQAAISVNNTLTSVPEENSFYNLMEITLNSSELLNSINPFAEADRVVIEMRPTIFLKGYPYLKLPALLISVLSGIPATKTSLKALNFIGSVWSPVQTQVKVTDTKVSQRLDQFGFVNFTITTADSQDVAKSVYAAIQKGSLTFQTRVGSQLAGGSARIGSVPLDGISYGTGELLDPDSGQRIYLRTRLASLSFDKNLRSLFVSIEINTTYQSGFAAYLYSARFWAYISDVISASLTIPSTAAINAPTAWVKGQ